MTKYALILSALFFTGCAGLVPPNYIDKEPVEIQQATVFETSEFDKLIKYVGPEARRHSAQMFGDSQKFVLRAFKPKTGGDASYQLYVDVIYSGGGWRFYESVSFLGGDLKDLTVINREVLGCQSGCTYMETLGVDLTEEQMKAIIDDHAEIGLSVRLNAKSGHETIVMVPKNYLLGFTAAIENRNG